jgi:hypothetical protein
MSPRALLIHGPARLVTTQPNVSRHGLWKFRRAKLLSPPLVYIFVLHEINCIINYESLTNALKQLFHFWIFRIVVVPTQTSAAPHDLPNRTILMSMRTISCMRHICNFLLPGTLHRRHSSFSSLPSACTDRQDSGPPEPRHT